MKTQILLHKINLVGASAFTAPLLLDVSGLGQVPQPANWLGVVVVVLQIVNTLLIRKKKRDTNELEKNNPKR